MSPCERLGYGEVPLALTILSVNLIGDLANVLLRGDYRALIGLPVGTVMIFYLVRSGRWSKGFRPRTKGG